MTSNLLECWGHFLKSFLSMCILQFETCLWFIWNSCFIVELLKLIIGLYGQTLNQGFCFLWVKNSLHKLRIVALPQIKQQITVWAYIQKYLDSFVSKASCILEIMGRCVMVKAKIMNTVFWKWRTYYTNLGKW